MRQARERWFAVSAAVDIRRPIARFLNMALMGHFPFIDPENISDSAEMHSRICAAYGRKAEKVSIFPMIPARHIPQKA
jgi:hypothetical protein